MTVWVETGRLLVTEADRLPTQRVAKTRVLSRPTCRAPLSSSGCAEELAFGVAGMLLWCLALVGRTSALSGVFVAVVRWLRSGLLVTSLV